MSLKKIIFIVGPTAVGKSDVAFSLAQNIQGEIVSCDSMQVYKEIHIASNKPSKSALHKIRHHLIGILSVEEGFDVARYDRLAREAIQEIHGRNRIPIVVGGSGMYMQVLLDGIFEGGMKNEALRKDLRQQAKQYGNQYLYDRLNDEDPQAAKKIHPNDVRRVIRALEICLTEKLPVSEVQKKREGLWGKYDISLFALNRDRRELYSHIDDRVKQMVLEGLPEEIKRLNKASWSLTARKIIGVQEMQGYLGGQYDLEKAVELMKLNTRRLAKRQLTWFRKENRLKWILISETDTSEKIAEAIEKDIKLERR
ncbi:MAG: tRNA (adenosine(37)-N6)-dimethylallyltransferase MiaA [Candidatus Omnitrophica bacterium]|nr:tRNA (adenosine(37)-N6)-dimethylallyltransferase MiaA [Candidatus Omnitrophota bacterium]